VLRHTVGVTDSKASVGQGESGDLALAVLAILAEDKRSAEIRLRDLVGTLDRGVLDALGADRPHGVEAQILARAVVSAGRPLAEHAVTPARAARSAVAATLVAAEAYVQAPGDDTYDAYFKFATNSYPYGTGEGHYGIGEECEPGSGCYTGAGTLYFVGREVGFGVVIEALQAELVPWLRGLAGSDWPPVGTSGV
jgi:hypothetical protein